MLSTVCWLDVWGLFCKLYPRLRENVFRISQAPIGRGWDHTPRVVNGQETLSRRRDLRGSRRQAGRTLRGKRGWQGELTELVEATTRTLLRVDVAKRHKT